MREPERRYSRCDVVVDGNECEWLGRIIPDDRVALHRTFLSLAQVDLCDLPSRRIEDPDTPSLHTDHSTSDHHPVFYE